MGITFRVHHLTWVTMAGEAKRDFPACIGYQSPWYKEYSMIEDYFARVNVVLTRGKPLTRVAVIHPIESYWLCFGPVDSGKGESEFREQCFRDLTHWLLHGLVDFDFISESLFPTQTALEDVSSVLKVRECSYDTVLVPNLRTIRSTTLARLRKFAAAGGAVFICGETASLVDAKKPLHPPDIDKCEPVPWTRYHILDALRPFRDIRIETAAGTDAQTLLYQMREDGDERFVFICNTERMVPIQTTVSLKGTWDVEVMDGFTGHESKLETAQVNSWTVFPFHFEGTASVMLHLKPGKYISGGQRQLPTSIAFGKSLGDVELKTVELSEPNVLLLDYAKYKLDDDEEWKSEEEVLRIENIVRAKLKLPLKLDNLAQPWTIAEKDRKPVASLKLQFSTNSNVEIRNSHLALENSQFITVICNGMNVPSKPSGWWVDEDIHTIPLPSLPAGTSTIELTYPFGPMTNIERVYLLGNFGVTLRGHTASLSALDLKSLYFGDYTNQGLPFYAGNVIYNCSFTIKESEDGQLTETAISIPQFVAPILSLDVDGKPAGKIITEPRMLVLPPLQAGTHDLSITSYGNRENAFGTVHLPDGVTTWYGPNEFRTDRPGWWMKEYNVKRMGVLATPSVKGRGNDVVKVQPHILRFPYERARQRS